MFDFNIVKRNRRRSSEAPAILNTNATYNFKQQQLSRRRSLDSNSHVGNINLLPSVSGMTTSTAIKKLIEEIEGIEREREGTKFMDFNSSFILKNKTVILRFVSLTIIFIKSLIRASDKNTNTHYLSCYILFFLFLELALIFSWKSRNFGAEIKNKLRQIQRALLSDSITIDELYDTPNIKIPLSNTISNVHVIRDGRLRFISLNLLVPGDLFLILQPPSKNNVHVFLPFKYSPIQESSIKYLIHRQIGSLIPENSSFFICEEFPLTSILRKKKCFLRTSRFIFSALQSRIQSLLNGFLFILSLSTAVIIKHEQPEFGYLNIILPLTLISSPVLYFFWWICGTSYLSLLTAQLIRSETPFCETSSGEDGEGGEVEDEFDEDAPPPVKNIRIESWRVFFKVISVLFHGFFKSKRGGSSSSSSSDGSADDYFNGILHIWDGDVIEALGLTSVLCFVDREGPISNPHSRPRELIIPTTDEAEIVAIELVPSIYDPKIVKPTISSLSGFNSNDLRAIGLSLILSSNCEESESQGVAHCRFSNENETCNHFKCLLPEHFQSCYCNLSKEIGFDSSAILNRFKRIKTIWHSSNINTTAHTKTKHHHHHHGRNKMVSILVKDTFEIDYETDTSNNNNNNNNNSNTPSAHLFTFGQVSDVLGVCSHAFAVNSQIISLTDSLTRKLIDFDSTMRSCDVNCLAFSYRPVFADEQPSSMSGMKGHIFLGLLSVSQEPKEHFQAFIDDLEAAGIRFAYFSPYREQQSKAFGDRLGLETDWNSCILLSEHPNPSSHSPGYLAISDIKARLPRGVNAIRPHLEAVDDIPLHVSIFAECDTKTASEMIKIYKEAGEVVTVIGSCRSVRNSECFSTAHFAIGCDVLKFQSEYQHDQNDTKNHNCNCNCNFSALSLLINSASLKLILPIDSNPYIITELIRESRTILQNSASAWEFFIGSIGSMIIFYMFTCPSELLKDDFMGMAYICGSTVMIAGCLVLGPYDPMVMKTHPTILDTSKCPGNVDQVPVSLILNSVGFTFARFIPFWVALNVISWIFKHSPSAFVLFSLITILPQSTTFMHCVRPSPLQLKLIFHQNPYLVISIIISAVFGFVCTFQKCSWLSLVASVLLSILSGVLCVMWQEFIKRVYLHDKYDQAQKRAKLLFNTKLGMHSPV